MKTNTMIKKNRISFLLLLPLLLITASCEKYLDVNKNIDAPNYIEGYLYLAGIEQGMQGLYWDVRATGPLAQMMGTSSYTTFAQNYYSAGSDAGGELWRMVYWLHGWNLENMINQSIEKEEWTLAGIGLAIKAFSWDQLTKQHGEIILKDAFNPDLFTFGYNYQDTAYSAVRNWAYKAIEYLEKPDNSLYYDNISSRDFIYKGDKAKWIKFAYGVIVSNLSSLSNKSDFATTYAQELIDAAGKSFTSFADDATLKVSGGGTAAAQSGYNNFWGTARVNLTRNWFQHEYAVQVFTGTVPYYDEATGNKVSVTGNTYYPNRLADKQIICDTIVSVPGHYDPRVSVKLATADDATYLYMDVPAQIKKRKYYGGSFTSFTGPIGSAPSFYGRNSASSTVTDGRGRWLYRDDAPYILMTCSQLKFCLAEAYWKLGMKTEALQAFKDGVKADMDFSANYIYPGSKGEATGGDKILKATFVSLANEYLAGPYVGTLSIDDFTLSHIMMQKWVSLYPWGALEAWVDMRKYHYDIAYTGDYPSSGNGWTLNTVTNKWDTNPGKVFKGLFLQPANVTSRRTAYSTFNEGSPCYRIRPRYNSEYMWNKPALSLLKPISGMADNYQCSIPWFAYPGELPTN